MKSTSILRTCCGTCFMAVLLAACGENGDAEPERLSKGVNGTHLHVTYNRSPLGEDATQRLYYGTQNVGTSASASVRIANQGADIYPLKSIGIIGEHADQFSVNVLDEIVLNPAEVLTVDVVFRPTTEQEITDTALAIKYETIKMVEESVNQAEQGYYKAGELASRGKFVAAGSMYEQYLENDPVTSNRRRAAIRLPIMDEADVYDADRDMRGYLEAMGHRDDGNHRAALASLDRLIETYPDSYLADDAWYLKGYIQLLDMDDPKAALLTMQELRKLHPDTTYYDTSLYSDAMAQLDIGNTALARTILLELKQRHTGVDALGIQIPKDNLLSRMWFDRAENLLKENFTV